MLKIDEVFDVNRSTIMSKYPCSITIDEKDYDEKSLTETATYFSIPGILEFYFPDFNDFCQIAIPYEVDLQKTENVEKDKKLTTIYFEKDVIVISKDYVVDDVDIGLLNRLMRGQIKYIKDPKIILTMIADILKSPKLVHLELVISNMFRVDGQEEKRCRQVGSYENAVIIGVANQPFRDSWERSMAYERLEKVIELGLVRGNDPVADDPILKVLREDFKRL